MTEDLATNHAPPPPDVDGGWMVQGQRHAVPRCDQIAAAAELIRSGRNVVIVGGRESGRTTCLRALVSELRGGATVVSASETARPIPLGAFAGVVRLQRGSSSTDRIAAVIDQLRTAGALLAVDDADLLDDESALVLLALAPHIPVLLTVNYRANVPDAVERLTRDHASTIELMPLDSKELLEIAEGSLGGLLDPGSLVRLCADGDGSPGHLVRCIAEARREGTLHDRYGVWSYEQRMPHSTAVAKTFESLVMANQPEAPVFQRRRDDCAAISPERPMLGPTTLSRSRLRLVGDPLPDDGSGDEVLRMADAVLRRGEPDAAARLLAPLLGTPRGKGDRHFGDLVIAQLHWAFAWATRTQQGLHPTPDSDEGHPARLARARAAAEMGDDASASTAALAIATSTDAPPTTMIDAMHLVGRLMMSASTGRRVALMIDLASRSSLSTVTEAQVAHLRALDRRDGRGLEEVAACFLQIDHRALAHEAITQAAMMHLLTGSPRHAGRCRAEAAALVTHDFRPTFAARRAVGQLPLLTRRERAVVGLIAKGRTLSEAAGELGCSRRTAESHLQHAYVKLGVNDRTALRSVAAVAAKPA